MAWGGPEEGGGPPRRGKDLWGNWKGEDGGNRAGESGRLEALGPHPRTGAVACAHPHSHPRPRTSPHAEKLLIRAPAGLQLRSGPTPNPTRRHGSSPPHGPQHSTQPLPVVMRPQSHERKRGKASAVVQTPSVGGSVPAESDPTEAQARLRASGVGAARGKGRTAQALMWRAAGAGAGWGGDPAQAVGS